MDWIYAHIISITTFTPLIAAILGLASVNITLSRWIFFFGSFISFLLSCFIWLNYSETLPIGQFSEIYPWLEHFGVFYRVEVNGLSLLFMVMCTFICPLLIMCIWDENVARLKTKLALILILETGMLGSLTATDLFLFYFFWEATLLPIYLIMGIFGKQRATHASTKLIIFNLFGSLLLLIGICNLYLAHAREFGFYTSNLQDLLNSNHLDLFTQKCLFLSFTLAFAVRLPFWPLHTWLLDAHSQAPKIGSAILSGILLKTGAYGFLRFSIPLFPDAFNYFSNFIVGLGILGAIWSAVAIYSEEDTGRIFAYASISHLSLASAAFAITDAGRLSVETISGGILRIISNGISMSALTFLLVFIDNKHEAGKQNANTNNAACTPWFTLCLFIAGIDLVGLPGTGGFVSNLILLLGAFNISFTKGGVLSLGALIGALAVLKLCKKILLLSTQSRGNQFDGLEPMEKLTVMPLLIAVIAAGCHPQGLLSKVRPSIDKLARKYQSHFMLKNQESSSHRAPTNLNQVEFIQKGGQ